MTAVIGTLDKSLYLLNNMCVRARITPSTLHSLVSNFDAKTPGGVMTLVATVNGKPVYSDKRTSGIVNSRIFFKDGSWCDVATGDVHNVGSGYIRIGGSDASSGNSEIITKPAVIVRASALDLDIRGATVTIEPHDRADIEYTLSGTEDALKALKVQTVGNMLFIEETKQSGGNSVVNADVIGRNVFVGNGVSINSFGRGGMTIINGSVSDGGSKTNITIKAPRGASITARQTTGLTKIGAIGGSLTASINGSGDIIAQEVTSAQLNIQGSGDIEIGVVNGNATATIQGSGDIKIRDGEIPSLWATVQGSGDIVIGGTVANAILTVHGSGDIRVKQATGEVSKNVHGSGNIKVSRVR